MIYNDNSYDPLEELNKLLQKEIKIIKKEIKSIICSILPIHKESTQKYFFNNSEKILNDVVKNTNINISGYQKEFLMAVKGEDNLNVLIIEVRENLIIIHVAYNIIKFSKFEEKKFKDFNEKDSYKYWYRGHSCKSWKLIPSLYRKLSLRSNNALINNHYLERFYEDIKILSKINDVIPSKILSYEQLAFLQHSMSITPFLDFSTDYKSSMSFAVNDLSTPVDMQYRDAALYALKIGEEKIIREKDSADKLIKNIQVVYFNNRTYVSTVIRNNLWVDLIKNKQHSEYYLIDIKTNDRMRIQNGTFVLFDKVIIFDSDLYFSSRTNVKSSKLITKYVIGGRSGERFDLYKDIVSGSRKYHIKYMLNPYDFMHTL